jgi:Fe-S-cluster containining protein
MAEFLDIDPDVLAGRMLEPFKDGYTVREAEDGRCIFYENGCVVYPERPIQCATFPFWFQNMRSPSAWEQVRLRCPGAGSGRLFSKEEIIGLVHASYPVYLKVADIIYTGGSR